MRPPGKLKRKARNTPGHSHYFTCSTFHRKPYLLDERVCEALAKRINEAAKEHNFVVLAYVFMPDHIHLLIHPLNEIYEMEIIMKAIKQGVSNKAKARGWIPTDLWERGGGYDRNVFTAKVRLNAIRYIHNNPVVEGLAEEPIDYFWSSAKWYLTEEQGVIACRYFASLEEF